MPSKDWVKARSIHDLIVSTSSRFFPFEFETVTKHKS